MIAGFSKAVTLYLAPLLYLTALLLSLFAFLAPAVMLRDRVALLTVTPSLSLTQPASSKVVDGASVFLGVLGSCARKNKAAKIICTVPTINPTYDVSVLPLSAPSLLLSEPMPTVPGFIAVALALSFVFFVTFNLISFRHKMGKAGATFEKPVTQRLSAWVGVIGFMIGLMAFLVLRMWFGKAVKDFNRAIQALGSQGPPLVANIGNAFTMVWVAYAFYAVPVIISLAKLNVLATPAKGY